MRGDAEDRAVPFQFNATTRKSLVEIEESDAEISILGKIVGWGTRSFFQQPPGKGRAWLCWVLTAEGQPGMLVRPSEYSASKCLSLLSCKVGVKILPAP